MAGTKKEKLVTTCWDDRKEHCIGAVLVFIFIDFCVAFYGMEVRTRCP